jgi:hypothetical protein
MASLFFFFVRRECSVEVQIKNEQLYITNEKHFLKHLWFFW